MDNWDSHARQQHSYQRSQSVSIPASQFSSSGQPSHYAGADYGHQHNFDRRPPSYPTPLPPLQVNPTSFSQADAPPNLPSSSLPGGQPLTRADRHRAQSVALTSIGQRDPSYGSSNYRTAHRTYTQEASVPISRHTQVEPPQVPYISSAMSYQQHPHMGMPSRVMPPLSELDRRALPTVDEVQPRPKPHVCDQCSAAFSRAHDLKRHIETHKGDRPHKCPTCTKAFSRKDALQRHQSMAQCGVDLQEPY